MTWLIIFPLLVYLCIGALAYFFAESMIFQPQPISYYFKTDKNSFFTIAVPNSEKTTDGKSTDGKSTDGKSADENITAKYIKHDTAEFTILFSHGNAEDIFSSESYCEKLSGLGFNVLAYDYRGYGKSDGKPSERNAYVDIETAYNYLVNELKTPPEKIIIMGRSLGGAISVDLASRKPCAGLILESSFVSAYRVMCKVRLYPFDQFENIKKIGLVKSPILIIHGKRDSLITHWHGEKLFEKANNPKTFFSVEDAGHNDVAVKGGKDYWQAIKDFANTVKPLTLKPSTRTLRQKP
jgi:abhydrolase domain-containing protein 17